MANIISNCPRCGTINLVRSNYCMLSDMGTGVSCKKCNLRFCAKLSKKDVKALFGEGDILPHVKGDEDYTLKSIYYPNP